MTQNQEWIENNFHGKRVMYGGFALLDHSLLDKIVSSRLRSQLIGHTIFFHWCKTTYRLSDWLYQYFHW